MRLGVVQLGALLGAVLALSACGVGKSWEVRMEVAGPREATVQSSFAGGEKNPRPASRKLPWQDKQSVGFGFNDLSVTDAAPGTVCRIFVDGRLRDERVADQDGAVTCHVNNQE
ncbi:MmpS family transport accessory protein [Amycolatopsis sp.]|uniref:MmpS family transport accessory protein n=1 Tax=Amycolatopsis sp. TaxID=37632 RepID=UPI002E016E51|nr:MmpS family transport accessory protein [Amycolatopsis sp.]